MLAGLTAVGVAGRGWHWNGMELAQQTQGPGAACPLEGPCRQHCGFPGLMVPAAPLQRGAS